MREVYVGDVPMDLDIEEITCRLEDALNFLPDFRARYEGISVFPSYHVPCMKTTKKGTFFFFLEVCDTTLACTVVALSGIRVRGHSLRICYGKNFKVPSPLPLLDLEPLKQKAMIPHVDGPGAVMLSEVFLGGLQRGSNHKEICELLSKFLLSLPAVQERFPCLTAPVLHMKSGSDFCFVVLENEVLASTVVAMGKLLLGTIEVRSGWPVHFNANLAPPPLPVQQPDPEPGPSPSPAESESDSEGDVEVDPNCEVFVGGTRGLEMAEIWEAVEDELRAIPAFQEQYQEAEPVLQILSVAANATFAFVRVMNATLASTLVDMQRIRINGKTLTLGRPANYDKRQPAVPGLPRKPREERAFHMTAVELNIPPPPAAVGKVWVGGLPEAGSQQQLKELLDMHVSELVVSLPEFDVAAGPPIVNVTVDRSCRWGFVYVSEERLALPLIHLIRSSLFLGRPLKARFGRGYPKEARSPLPGAREARPLPSPLRSLVRGQFASSPRIDPEEI